MENRKRENTLRKKVSYGSKIPRPSYTLSLLLIPQRIARSRAMTVAATFLI